MIFRGIHKLSLIDYPGKICTTLFVGGCNFRCQYCHNPELVIEEEGLPKITEEEVVEFLKERKGFLDGICITGGEPTLYKELPQFINKIKTLSFLVKLDTNGTNPTMLQELLKQELVDYVAMDIKGRLSNYPQIVGKEVEIELIKESAQILLSSSIEYEFRTTVFPQLFSQEDAKQISKWLRTAKRYVLQQPNLEKTLERGFKKVKLYTREELERLSKILPNCIIRWRV